MCIVGQSRMYMMDVLGKHDVGRYYNLTENSICIVFSSQLVLPISMEYYYTYIEYVLVDTSRSRRPFRISPWLCRDLCMSVFHWGPALSARFVQPLSPCKFQGDHERCGSTNG